MTTRPLPPRPPAAPPTSGLILHRVGPPQGRRIVLYGPGGIGKTSLALAAPGPLVVFDLDASLSMLQPAGDVQVAEAADWTHMLAAINGPGWDSVQTIAIDTATCAQEWCEQWVYKNVKGDKGIVCARMEDYGFGKGYRHTYDAFCTMLGALENHTRLGRNVILVCHEALFKVTNPEGEDYSRHEPKLQDAGDGGKSSIKLRVRDWADTVACMLEDVTVDGKTGKAKGCGTRSLYCGAAPYYVAKHRQPIGTDAVTCMPVTATNGGEVWGALLGA